MEGGPSDDENNILVKNLTRQYYILSRHVVTNIVTDTGSKPTTQKKITPRASLQQDGSHSIRLPQMIPERLPNGNYA